MKVHDSNDFNTEPEFVLNKWKHDFSTLYNPPDHPGQYDQPFYESVLQSKSEYEQNPTETNDMVNVEISYDEIERLVKKAKNNKALGIDFVPNEVLKQKNIILALWRLFRLYFTHSLTPSIWLKAIICPIPKSSCTDPYSPLQYRGISLLSNISKIYSGLLNNRIVSYCQ